MKTKEVTMKKVQSSNIQSIGYLKESKHAKGDVFIQFKNGNIYKYKSVDAKIYEDLMNSESKGKFIHRMIKNSFEAEKQNSSWHDLDFIFEGMKKAKDKDNDKK